LLLERSLAASAAKVQETLGVGRCQGVAEAWEQARAWDDTPPPAAAVREEPAKPGRISIADAVEVFLTNRQGAKIAAATLRKYRTFTKQLTDFSDKRGYVMLDQFTSADIDVFYSGLESRRAREGQTSRHAARFLSILRESGMVVEKPGQCRHEAADGRESCC
jgi:hypothetical protein